MRSQKHSNAQRPLPRPRAASRQRGSVLILTLMAMGMIAGAFLYIGVIGSRSAETTRARTAADAAAMGAATIKARTMNYEAFILLADSVLLPLRHVAQNVGAAQVAFCTPCLLAPACPPNLKKACLDQLPKLPKKTKVANEVGTWLGGLEQMAEALDTVGPFWAEGEAKDIGTSSSYSGPGDHGVSVAASFPLPDMKCGRLGVDMVDPNKKDPYEGRDACHDLAFKNLPPLEPTYLCPGIDPNVCAINGAGWVMIFASLALRDCDSTYKVPMLAQDWKKQRFSRGMALEKNPNDDWQLHYLEALRQTSPSKTLQTGWLLGMGCAEHYSQDHQDRENLWHMDWRARLVPCEYEDPQARAQVTGCGVGISNPQSSLILLQFQRQVLLGIAPDWKW